MKRTANKLTALFLAAIVAITSAQFPAVPAYAQEQTETLPNLPEDTVGDNTPADQTAPPTDDGNTGTPDETPSETPGTKPETPAETPVGKPDTPEAPDDKTETPDNKPENPEDQTETPDGEKGDTPDEEQPDTPDGEEEDEDDAPDATIPETVSVNALSTTLSNGELIESSYELKGVYQFGNAPTQESASSYSARPRKAPKNGISIEAYLYQQLLEKRKLNSATATIDISAYQYTNIDDLGLVFSGVLNENPELYDIAKSFRYVTNGMGQITSLEVNYVLNLDHDKWERGFTAAKAAVTNPSNQLQTAIELHDYLAVNCAYDTQNFNNNTVPAISHSTYGVFANRVAVCDGYALAYKYLLKQFGINCYMVTSDTMKHAWNLIELNGNYYQVDVTWDDPSWDLVGRACHNYMFLSDTAFAAVPGDDHHRDWSVTEGSNIVPYTATDTTYDSAFWTDSTAPLVFDGNACYYTAFSSSWNKAEIRKKESALTDITTQGSQFHVIGTWPVTYPADYQFWQGAFSGLFQTGGRLYYNDNDEIRSIALDGTDDQSVFKPDSTTPGWTNGYIYGCAFYPEPPDNPSNPYKIHYSLHITPNLTAAETVLVVDTSLPQPEDPIPARLTRPTKTTYLIGEALDLTGGKVEYPSADGRKTENLADLAPEKIYGFDSSTAGIKSIAVTYAADKDPLTFDVLIVAKPVLADNTAALGQTLDSVDLSEYNTENGTYSWKNGSTALNTEGEQTFTVIFTPKDLTKFQSIELELTLNVQKVTIALEESDITLEPDSFVYNGRAQTPNVTVTHTDKDGTALTLVKDRDYTLTYKDNKNAGTATVTVEGKSAYTGSFDKTFTITKAPLTVTAKDKTIRVGDPLPDADSYEYTATGLLSTDILLTKPVFTCTITATDNVGEYEIIPSDADAGSNYEITYVNGKLTVAVNTTFYTVRFDVQGHGTAPAALTGLAPRSKVPKPADPTADGYRFDGWFKEAACNNTWRFNIDIVQANMTLYAKWTQVDGEDDGFTLSEVPDLVYTGKAQKPALSVSYGKTLLKSGRDYTLKYYNNINVNAGGIQADKTSFNASLPYVEVIGKGNYAAVLKQNFNILPRPIGDGSKTPASDVKLKVTDQFATANRAAKPFSSVRSVTAMRISKDFSLLLTVVSARDQSGTALSTGTELADASIPAGYSGEFLLTVTGLNNYAGSIVTPIYVTDKVHLLKNMTITLGKNLKNIPFQGSPIELTPSEILTPDTFVVKYGKTALRYGTDYTVRYQNNNRVGKAELIAVGIGEYAGTKSAFFTIKGKAFNTRTVRVSGIENRVYTGLAHTQDKMSLLYGAGTADERPLRQDIDYTVGYAKNIDKGTATITFTGLAQAGFTGSFKKTFKITPASITDTTQAEAMADLSFRYNRSGVKPVDEIVLTNPQGFVLQNKKDYTLRYQNNSKVAEKTSQKPPTVIVKGKGNYTGELNVFFTIRKADFDAEEDGLKFTAVSIPYQAGRPADYAYTPVINVWDGNKKLRLNKDYTITYLENTQAEYEGFVKTLGENPKDVHPIPRAVITPTADSPYLSSHTVLLPIYMTELTKNNLEVKIVGETFYTGSQVKPKVEVSYKGGDGKILLEEGNHKDYVIVYGTNTQVGKNKGSLTIYGTVPYYGGSVTLKFDIQKRSFSK